MVGRYCRQEMAMVLLSPAYPSSWLFIRDRNDSPDQWRMAPYLSAELPHYGFASHLVEEAFAAVDIDVEYGFFPWQRSYNYAREGKDPDGGRWHGTLVWVPTEERKNTSFIPIVSSATRKFFFI